MNGLISTNSEQSAYYDFTLRAGVVVNGVFTQLQFNGQTDIVISKNWGIAIGKASVCIPPNTDFYITNRRVATDNGAAGSYNVITTTGGTTFRQDGIISGTDATKDYTMGVGIAYGAKCGTPVISGGLITSIPVNSSSAGVGYTAGLNLYMWYGAAGSGQPAAQYSGSGVSGYGNPSGGQLSSITVSAGGTGHNSSNPPLAFVGGAGNATTGFGTNTAAYGPSLITGIPRKKNPSILLIGDSITSGYGSVDAMGDLTASFGVYEQVLVNRLGANVHKMAVTGESGAGWNANYTQQLNFMDTHIKRGLRPSHVVIALGTNDFLTNSNTNVVSATQTNINNIANLWRARGAKIILTTVPPNNSTTATTNKFTTLAEQSPTLVGGSAANFQVGGYVDQYNTALRAGAIVNSGIIDISSYCRDATTPSRWRVDTYGGATAFCATDGTHPSVGVGIPYLVANMTLPSFS